jgi:hypothetical protein
MLRLHRTGYIKTNTKSDNQCKDVGHTDYRYEAIVSCQDGELDDQGFIIDHTIIHKLVEKYFNESVDSCERMAKGCGYKIYLCCIEHGITPNNVYIRINPVPDASKQQNPENFAFFEWSLREN